MIGRKDPGVPSDHFTSRRLRAATAVATIGFCLTAAPSSAVRATAATGLSARPAEPGPFELWLTPSGLRVPSDSIGLAAQDLTAGHAARALPVFNKATADLTIGGYARFYQGRAQLALNQPRDAAVSAEKAAAVAGPTGYLSQVSLVLLADADQALGDNAGAVRALQTLVARHPLNPEPVYLRLGNAANLAGDRALAIKSWRTLYDDYPLSDQADDAAAMLTKVAPGSLTPTTETLAADFSRAEQFFDAKRYTEARRAFAAIRAIATRDDRDRADLRVAECDQVLKHTGPALDALKDLLAKPTLREPETRYYYLSALRDSGRIDEYVALANAFVERNPADPFAETTLFDMSQYFTRQDDDARAAAVAADAFRRFPAGVHADRMAWRAGWWAYKNGEFATTIAIFTSAATTLRHADLRPSWLYWIGRADDRLNNRADAVAGYRLCIADYRNTYYGHEAERQLAAWHVADAVVDITPRGTDAVVRRADPLAGIIPGAQPANAPLVRALLSAGLYDDAMSELRLVQRDVGSSPLIEATIAYALNRKGELRPAIQAMRKAYPQFLAAGGEGLPADLLTVIFPVAYWDLIRKYAAAHKLDPYLMAALIAQESTFDAGVKSTANAWGLMQIEPSTGREYARKLGITPFRTARLTEPEVNVRIGMAFFADLLQDLGDLSLALAAYNAGEDRAQHWKAARQGVDRDEFIDDIPYLETQGYVRHILGTAEDYRRLYPIGKANSAAGTVR